MKFQVGCLKAKSGDETHNRVMLLNGESTPDAQAELLFCFSTPKSLNNKELLKKLKENYPKALLVSCSTGKSILQEQILEEDLSFCALRLEKSTWDAKVYQYNAPKGEQKLAQQVINDFKKKGLRVLMILSDGLCMAHSVFVEAVDQLLDDQSVVVCGGLASDEMAFKETLTGLGDQIAVGQVVVIGFYGKDLGVALNVGQGWVPFGLERIVTKASGRFLYELDGESALDLYLRYLGPERENLPLSMFRFPLYITSDKEEYGLVRTPIEINEEEGFLAFSDVLKEGQRVQMMWGRKDELLSSSHAAAANAHEQSQKSSGSVMHFAFNCAGREAALSRCVADEIGNVALTLGAKNGVMGFFSYGEIGAPNKGERARLLNESLVICSLWET